jgi:hypothetical protein
VGKPRRQNYKKGVTFRQQNIKLHWTHSLLWWMSLAAEEIPFMKWNFKVHYCVYNILQLASNFEVWHPCYVSQNHKLKSRCLIVKSTTIFLYYTYIKNIYVQRKMVLRWPTTCFGPVYRPSSGWNYKLNRLIIQMCMGSSGGGGGRFCLTAVGGVTIGSLCPYHKSVR